MVHDITDRLKKIDSVLCQSATGSGKTVIMSAFIKEYTSKNPNNVILVSVHREELVEQTSLTLARFGILNEQITSGSKNEWSSNVYVGMTQTIWSRKTALKVDLMIIDEAHEQIHLKTFSLFPEAKRIGFTATPSINKMRTFYKCEYCATESTEKSVCCYNEETAKWTASVTMSEQYQDIILGPPIRTLIDEGSLVDEIVFSYNNFSNLEATGIDDYDENEIADESIKHNDNVLEEYVEKALGKKTMIFTASTKQNITLVETFKDYPIMSYDSVNNTSADRKGVVEWFKNTDGAILVSTGTFTTGFDVKEVECIIVNRPTSSLNLWHQIIGRGARPSDIIFKDSFIVIDLGGNVNRLGKWSDKVDWEDIFFGGLRKPKRIKQSLIQCDRCGYNWIGSTGNECPDCGHVNIPIVMERGERSELTGEYLSEKTTIVQNSIPLPNGKKIMEFVKRTTDSKNDFYRIIIDKYIDLWKLNNVQPAIYFQRIKNNTLISKIEVYIKSIYHYCRSLTNGVPRTYNYLKGKILDALAKIYL